jgi:hypothetical protein
VARHGADGRGVQRACAFIGLSVDAAEQRHDVYGCHGRMLVRGRDAVRVQRM